MTCPESDLEAETMTVWIRDRAREAPWGSGLLNPVVRPVTISAYCPRCGGPRGKPRNLNQCEDGAYYSVDVWANPCGHLDRYVDVANEADARHGAKALPRDGDHG